MIARGVGPSGLVVRTLVDGEALQSYPVSDMFFQPRELVSRPSHGMTLYPGDFSAYGTSLGTAPMDSGCQVEVVNDGVGRLSSRFE